jgi:hypothetical protein
MAKKLFKPGRVSFGISHVVNLNDPEMIKDARNLLYDDVMREDQDEVEKGMVVTEDPTATESDLDGFLVDAALDREEPCPDGCCCPLHKEEE